MRAPQLMDAESSFELIRRAQAGDREALDLLFSRYLPALERWAHGRLPLTARDMSDTQDLVQDAMKRTILNFDRFEYRGEGALRAYLHQAVVNLVNDHIRRQARRRRRAELDDHLTDAEGSPIERAITGQTFQRFESALAQMDALDARAIRARLELGCSYAEVAMLTGRPTADAARVAVARAVKELAIIMARERRRSGAA